jgi:hypothetical protein
VGLGVANAGEISRKPISDITIKEASSAGILFRCNLFSFSGNLQQDF